MIYGLGDIHRNINYLKWQLEHKKDCHIFHVGDYEVGFVGENAQIRILMEFNKWLAERNIVIYNIRGNHDDPKYFQGDHIYSNLQFLPDYTIIEVEDKKVLCIGGATSPDRRQAKIESDINEKLGQPRRYWDDEPFVLREDLLEKVKGINMLVTHTAPTYCTPILSGNYPKFMRDFAKHDKTLLDDIKKEREDMDKLLKILGKNNTIKHHIYGHFHRNDITDNLYTQHIVLDKNDLYPI
ncbi:MAG: putative hydrolase [uncultured marine phage]|uniref:Putative hydrolase n=1 Tax=uncultured marine phage TaxID=707152 RepID=A0A8D9CD07_9VIRU|nr:MAG: putative hydrolase [uncultured marine phage]